MLGIKVAIATESAPIKGVPAGYSRALINGQPATYNGRPVYAKFSGSTLVSLVYT